MNNGFDLVYNCTDDKHSGMIRIPSGDFNPETAFKNKYFIERPGKLVIGVYFFFFFFFFTIRKNN